MIKNYKEIFFVKFPIFFPLIYIFILYSFPQFETALIFLTILLLALVFSLTRVQFSNNLRIIEKVIFFLFVITTQYIILNPKVLFYVATPLKIERGVDLIFYVYILISLWIFIRNHIRLNMLNKKINKLTSKMALEDPIKTS